MKTLSKLGAKENFIILLALLVLSEFLFFDFALEPMYTKYKNFYKSESELKSKIATNIALLQKKEDIRQSHSVLFEKYKVAGFDEEELLKTKEEIERISSETGLKITKIQDIPLKQATEYKQFNFQMECNGKLDHIGKFVFQLSKSSMLLNVVKMKIQPESYKSDKLNLYITISRTGFPEF
jgi:Tfp pilus assembly protein PilO